MAGISDINKRNNMKTKERLVALEAESDQILEALFDNPSNSDLVSRLNEIDIEIVRLTGEKVLDCIHFK